MSRFASVVLDVDSTLSGTEGIEWLARRCDPEVRSHIDAETKAAMRGDVKLESVYSERLALIHPTRAEIDELADAYIASIAPGATEAIALIRDAGVRIVLVSGGLREAILPLAAHVGIPPGDVHAVPICFSADGTYVGYDTASPLSRSRGKPVCVKALELPESVVAVGDGMTDAELKGSVAAFVAFTGFARRERVVALADAVITSFNELTPLVLE